MAQFMCFSSKFAQYLIWEIPQQVRIRISVSIDDSFFFCPQFLPKAQSLLDDLLSDKPTNVNMLQGAPVRVRPIVFPSSSFSLVGSNCRWTVVGCLGLVSR